ncbi:hypothetical protein XAC217_830055 [Xanthomonas citri pv. citri]|nr:hypothetical protein XAC1083_760053 [Xanthomonas citri pv. citri]CEE86593.1 hypothetical protein XACLC80_960004 [Xanthomonas citri pv. citri]CEF47294.1 hypothetical protein XAC217_830055 [Xanthomonas citri pv. citri]
MPVRWENLGVLGNHSCANEAKKWLNLWLRVATNLWLQWPRGRADIRGSLALANGQGGKHRPDVGPNLSVLNK